jgi:hypothetical protein
LKNGVLDASAARRVIRQRSQVSWALRAKSIPQPQSATLITRALAVGDVELRHAARVLTREGLQGLALGAFLGVFGTLPQILSPLVALVVAFVAAPLIEHRLSKAALEENRRHSYQLLGATNIVLLIVTTITIFGDLETTMNALNSFGSDSILLWCMKHIYAGDHAAQIDLDFFMQEVSNRGHYNSSAFFSNPSQYLYYHIVFDEVIYELLMNRPPLRQCSGS